MKKRGVSIILAAFLLVTLLPGIGLFAAPSPTVYVKDGGTGDGSTDAKALGSLSDGLTALSAAGGTLIICGPTTLAANTIFPHTQGTVTVTSKNGSTDYIQTASAALTLSGVNQLNGATIFKDLKLISVKSNTLIICNSNKTVFDTGLICEKGGDSTNYIGISGGANISGAGSNGTAGAELTIKSGKWQMVRGGNRRQTGGEASVRVITGDISVTVEGGEFNDTLTGGGQNSQTGDIYMKISGGTFKSGVYGIQRFGLNTYNATHTGNVTMEIAGGDFKTTLETIQRVASPQGTDFYGTAILNIKDGTFSETSTIRGTAGTWDNLTVAGENTATCNVNSAKFPEGTLDIANFDTVNYNDGSGIIRSLRLSPTSLSVTKGKTALYQVVSSHPEEVLEWTIDSSLSTISANGLLTVSEDETSALLQISVKMKNFPDITASATAVVVSSGQETENGPVLFVADGGSGDGSTAGHALSSLNNAIGALKDGGTVVICAPYTISQDILTPNTSKPVLITSVFDGIDYRITNKAEMKVNGFFNLGGPVHFKNLHIAILRSSMLFSGNGYEMVLDEGITTEKRGSVNFIGITSGTNITAATAVDKGINGGNLTIRSGDWQIIRGGNRRATTTADNTVRTIQGDTTITISGGTFWDMFTAGGQNHQTGNIHLNVSGGVFKKGIHGLCDIGGGTLVGKHTGNINITVSGGQFGGEIAAAAKYDVSQLDGKFNLTMVGGDFRSLDIIRGTEAEGEFEALSGNNTSELEKTETVDYEYQGDDVLTLTNPIMPGADPSITVHNGMYYMMKAGGIDGKYCLYMYKSNSLAGLANAKGHVAWIPGTADGEEAYTPEEIEMWSKELWSPKLYWLDGYADAALNGWYIYVAADDGANANHRVFVLHSKNPDPTEGSGYKFLGALTDEDGALPGQWAIGPHILDYNNKRYYMMTGRDANNTEQYLKIAEMASPTHLKSAPVTFCKPDYDWEKVGASGTHPKVVEGATALIGPNGTVYIVYSASGSWGDYYCLGIMTLQKNGNPLNPSHWAKKDEPVFSRYVDENNPSTNVYGPGHAAFIKVSDGKGAEIDWIIYHGQLASGGGWGGRSIMAQTFAWDDNDFPIFGHPDINFTYDFETTRGDIEEIITGFTSVKNIESEKYTLSVTGGNATPSGDIAWGAAVQVKADSPATGKAFMRWEVDGLSGVDISKPNISFTMPRCDVKLTALFADKNETPDVKIDFINSKLTFSKKGRFTINDGPPFDIEDGGKLDIEDSWYGTELEIVHKSNGTTTSDSNPQKLAIPARPEAPSAEAKNGKIIGVNDTMEYSADGGKKFISCAGKEITRLKVGTYLVRVKATEASFSGVAATVDITVGSDEPNTGVSGVTIAGILVLWGSALLSAFLLMSKKSRLLPNGE